MVKRISDMNDDEYEAWRRKLAKLENLIDYKSMLISALGNDKKCPYCDNNTEGKDFIRGKLLQLMRKYNELNGRKYYISHIEGKKEWKV